MIEQKKIGITVGICAYNEENNIRKILDDVETQDQNGWELVEVLVYCDGCTDKTIQEAKTSTVSQLRILGDNDRKGKTYRISQICKRFKGNILIMLDADVRLRDNNVFNKLVKELVQHKTVMIAGGNTRPYTPKTFFEKAVYSTFAVFDESRNKIKDGNNIFGCTGGLMAVKRSLAKKISFADVVNDDDFFYFYCLTQGYNFKYVKNAVAYYKLPTNLKDYLRQNFRSNPNAVTSVITKYFGSIVETEYRRPKRLYFLFVIKEFFKNPTGVVYITLINLACKPFYQHLSSAYKLNWFTAQSTK